MYVVAFTLLTLAVSWVRCQPEVVAVGFDAFELIEAEAFSWAEVAQVSSYCVDLTYLSNTYPEAVVVYEGVDFGSGAEFVNFRLWGYRDFYLTGSFLLRLDSRNNTPFLSLPVGPTGNEGCEDFITITSFLSTFVSGVHDLYLTFASAQEETVAGIDWFYFNKTKVPLPITN